MGAGLIIGGGILKGIGAIKNKKAADRSAKEQRQLDEENIRLDKLEIAESISRTESSNRQSAGMAEAQIGASGFGGGSSMNSYLSTIKAEQASDVDWMKTSGASRTAIQEREAAARQRNSNRQARGNFMSGIASSFGTIGSGLDW